MQNNGAHDYTPRFDRVDKGITEIKDALTEAIRAQTAATLRQVDAIKGLETSITLLTTQVSTAISVAQNSIPIKAVFWMFLILLIALGGIEAFKIVPKLVGLI